MVTTPPVVVAAALVWVFRPPTCTFAARVVLLSGGVNCRSNMYVGLGWGARTS